MQLRIRLLLFIIIVTSAVAYFLLAYATSRSNFAAVISLYAVVFGGYLYLLRLPLTLKQGLGLALFFRLIFMGAIPALSDDYFRFIWDGTLLNQGENPYQHRPSFYLQPENATLVPPLNSDFYAQLNSPHYYSLYPPVCQALFGIANLFAGTNLWLNCLIMRFFILLAEGGSVFFLLRLLKWLQLPYAQVWWYALNPLIILELTGNLHPEGLLIFFLLGSIYLLLQEKKDGSAGLLGLAVGVKLWPLMFLPLLYKHLGFKNLGRYGAILILVLAVLFLPFLSPALVLNIFKSINLYFQQFEFNASIYYLGRWLAYQIWGYNLIAVLGPLLSILTVMGILYLGLKQNKSSSHHLMQAMLFSLTLYLVMATVVHPWYISTLIALTSLTRWQYPIMWSGLAFLSYASYQTTAYTENLTLVTLEYVAVYGYLFYECWQQKNILNNPKMLNLIDKD